MRILARCAVIFLAATAFAGDEPAQKSASTLKDGFTFNSTKKSGRTEWKVDGSAAVFLTPEIIEIKDVRATYYGDDGSTTVATTAKAILDKTTRKVTSDDLVTIVTKNAVTTGTGLAWDQEGKRGTLKKSVKVVFSQPAGKGVIP
ncbi:MAG: LPS export ABC transporter periplasmic protein LptC [Candidatus Aureabacteria bacterium]|nr:LPS export ABC transporter periplasmic protein LptC [Candidatus Auribacterota bacterium]